MSKLGMFQSSEKKEKKQSACPVTGKGAEFKPFEDTSYIANPYPFLKSIREEEPIFYSPDVDAWIVSKYEDVQAVFRDPKSYSAANARRRLTTKEVTLGGHTIPEGETILLMTGSANRDEALFDDGETFDITRDNAKKHLTLGFGAHFCMGAPLARIQMRIVLEELTKRIPHMKLVSEESYPSAPTLILRGPEKVLVAWDV